MSDARACARLGLFGGSFDPVHRAHLALARAALDALRLDRVLWIPAAQPWQKPRAMTEARHRLAMLELALQGEPRFAIDRREIERSGVTYTIDTVRELRALHPAAQLVLIIGADQHAGFHTWRQWREIAAEVRLAVAGRPGGAPAIDPEVAAFGFEPLPLPPMDVAATTIRGRVARGEPIDDLVPPGVARYIDREGLYRP